MLYRKKSVVVPAVQWTGLNPSEIKAFCGNASEVEIHDAAWHAGAGAPVATIVIHTLEGDHTALPGDFIIRGVEGEYYPCKPGIFAKTYELVTDDAADVAPEHDVELDEFCSRGARMDAEGGNGNG